MKYASTITGGTRHTTEPTPIAASLQLSSTRSMLSYAINASDVAAIALLLSDETFSHRAMPSTMGPESVGSRNKAETLTVFKGTFDKVMDLGPIVCLGETRCYSTIQVGILLVCAVPHHFADVVGNPCVTASCLKRVWSR